MQQEEDYIEREVARILSFIKDLISKITTTGANSNYELEINNEDFVSFLGVSLKEFIDMNTSEFEHYIQKIDTRIIEKLLRLFYEICNRDTDRETIKNLSKKSILLIEYIDKKEKIFSLERMQLKKELSKQ